MGDDFQKILDSLGEKVSRSRLAPYHDLIMELRRRRRTYREIQQILRERCRIQISISTLHEYLKIRRRTGGTVRDAEGPRHPRPQGMRTSKERPITSAYDKPTESISTDEIRQRIAALKQSRPEPAPEKPIFHYDPNKPLTLKADE